MKKDVKREWYVTIMIPIFTLVLMVIAVALARKVNDAQIVNVALVAGLVGVTTWYSYSTAKMASEIRMQADASVKMAEEMRDARHDALRPIIDFRFRDWEARSGGALGIGARGEVPPELHGQLWNIGVGPAIDLYSFSRVDQVNRPRYDFEPLKAGEGHHQPVELSVQREGSLGILEIYYRDVYRNLFRSRIEIIPVEGVGVRTKLQVEKLQE